MLFNSFRFVFFFLIVTSAYFALPHRYRWVLLLAASCMFYMLFVPVYVLVLFGTIVIDYFAALWIERATSAVVKRRYLYVSIVSVCATLFAFKYFDFFASNVNAVAHFMHWPWSVRALGLVLPIGLSFHTFQSLSYVIEVYRGSQRAERHFGIYALYVMYFPQLVAGPIERPQNLLPQFHEEKHFDAARLRDGLSLALWGLFKKVVVADSLGLYVDAVYDHARQHNGTTLLIATYFFAFQIYCDFSGYSDIARGVSRVYGIDLMRNFDTPYFASSPSEFWKRWHISLSTWFKDYVYVPLGGNRVPLRRELCNLACVFTLSGLWHGADWTFVVWGSLNGLYLIGERLLGLRRDPRGLVRVVRVLATFHLVLVGWVFFRAADVTTAGSILRSIVLRPGPVFRDPMLVRGALAIAAVLALDALHRRKDYHRHPERYPFSFRLAHSLVLVFGIVLFGIDGATQFIYFQF